MKTLTEIAIECGFIKLHKDVPYTVEDDGIFIGASANFDKYVDAVNVERGEAVYQVRNIGGGWSEVTKYFYNNMSVEDGKRTLYTALQPPVAPNNLPNKDCTICNGSGQYCVGTSGSEVDGNAPILERCECYLDNVAPKQPYPNHNWCIGCTPDDCSGCGTEPNDRRKNTDQSAYIYALKRIKLRLHFMSWPAETYWNAGSEENPNWIPDWRYECQLIDNLLNGTPITTPEKPQDTVPANQLPKANQSEYIRRLEDALDNLVMQVNMVIADKEHHISTGNRAFLSMAVDDANASKGEQ